MTRAAVCTTCDRVLAGPPRCELMRCCGSGEASEADYRAALSNPQRWCPHPEGDRWARANAALEPLPAEGLVHRRRLEMVTTRVRKCVACAAFCKPLDCADAGPLNARIGDPAFECPRREYGREVL